MWNYYEYLWKANWLELLAFLLLSFFVICRLVWKIRNHGPGSSIGAKMLIIIKGLSWLGILGIYFYIISSAEPDLFASEQWIQGEVASKVLTESQQPIYRVEVRSDNSTVSLIVDQEAFSALTPGTKVKMSYLPYRQQVVTCEVLQ